MIMGLTRGLRAIRATRRTPTPTLGGTCRRPVRVHLPQRRKVHPDLAENVAIEQFSTPSQRTPRLGGEGKDFGIRSYLPELSPTLTPSPPTGTICECVIIGVT